MITESDNSATNMLLSATGGINSMNQALRRWGFKETRVNDWLPDMAGENKSTAREMATLSRVYIKEFPESFINDKFNKRKFHLQKQKSTKTKLHKRKTIKINCKNRRIYANTIGIYACWVQKHEHNPQRLFRTRFIIRHFR